VTEEEIYVVLGLFILWTLFRNLPWDHISPQKG
jgi:hypothetical protein